jgi:hypothetical protein
MLSLQPNHITDLYVFVDDLLPSIPKPKGGRPLILGDNVPEQVATCCQAVPLDTPVEALDCVACLVSRQSRPTWPESRRAEFLCRCHWLSAGRTAKHPAGHHPAITKLMPSSARNAFASSGCAKQGRGSSITSEGRLTQVTTVRQRNRVGDLWPPHMAFRCR